MRYKSDRDFMLHELYFSMNLLSAQYPLDEKLLLTHTDYWEWRLVSRNQNISWSTGLLKHFMSSLDWKAISENPSLPWDIDLIVLYQNRWDWDYLSRNTGVPWSEDVLKKFEGKWNWKELSQNTSLPWSIDLIETFYYNWDWYDLSENPGLWDSWLNNVYTKEAVKQIIGNLLMEK